MNSQFSVFLRQRTGRSIALAMVGCLLFSTLFSTATEPDHQFRVEWDSANNLFRLTWPSVNGRTYFLQHTDDLILQPWNWVPLIESGNGTTKEWAFEPTEGTDRGFWRLASSDIATSDASGSDFDGDGVSNMAELLQGTSPLENLDLLGDGLPDDWQIYKGLNPNDPADGALGDKDEDGLTNAEELEAETDVNNPDSDGDGALDGVDGWANEPLLSPPRLPIVRYAVVDLGEGSASRINNVNQVLLENADGPGLWTQGQIDPILDGETAFHNVSGLNDHGEVVVTYQEETERQEYQYNESTMLLAKQVIGIWKAGSVTPVPFYSDILGELTLPKIMPDAQFEVDYGEYGTEINNNSVILGSIGCGIGIEESYGATALWNESAEIVGDITGGNIWDTENGFYLTLPVIGQATSISATDMNDSTLIGTYFITKKRSNAYMTGHFTDTFGLEDTLESGTMYWNGELHKLEGNLAGVPYHINSDGHFIGYAQGDYWQNAIWIKNGSGYNRIFGGISGRLNNKMQIISGSTLWQNFKSYNLVALVPAANGSDATWEGVGGTDINNQGIICGTSKRIRDDQGNPITPENQKNHAIMLIPMAVVRETQPGSGKFKSLKNGGLSKQAKLPIYKSESGVGIGDGGTSGGYGLTVLLAQNLTNNTVDTMTVKLINSNGSFSETLTETTIGSGIFKNATNTFTMSLSPVVETTDGAIDHLDVLVTHAPLGLINGAFTLSESSANSCQFAAVVMHMVVEMSGPLNTGSPDQIAVTIMSNVDSGITWDTLTETADDSREFSSATGELTVTISALSGVSATEVDTMNAMVDSSMLYVPHFSLSLTESGADSKEFTNYQKQSGDVSPTTPEDDGQGVFYVETAGTTTMDINLQSGENIITVQAEPVPGETGKLRTGKLALIAKNDEFTSNDIQTLEVNEGEGLKIEVSGSQIPGPAVVNNAFVARCFSIVTMPGGNTHCNMVKDRLVTKLGWTVPVVYQSLTKASALTAISKHSLWYSFSHSRPTAFGADDWIGFTAYSSAIRWGTAVITPSEVANANGASHEYAFVFLNACFSADDSSVTNDMVAAFNTKSYVGWNSKQNTAEAVYIASPFFDALDGGRTVGQAVSDANATLGSLSIANLQAVVGADEIVDITP